MLYWGEGEVVNEELDRRTSETVVACFEILSENLWRD
jgi:hypothetical protein